MGANCLQRSQQGDHLPADAHSDDGREELDRQEALHRQETELTDKQTHYLALLSQLEKEKAQVTTARRDLSEALSESEIFKSTIRELSARLRECEATVSLLKQAREEHERLAQKTEEVDDSLLTELEATRQQVQSASSELLRAKTELETQQRSLRKTESSIHLLEKLELEMESELGEEMSKHEDARRKAHLRSLFLFAVRRIHVLSLRRLLQWRHHAVLREQQVEALSLQIEHLGRQCGEVHCPDLTVARRKGAELAELCSRLSQVRGQLEDALSSLPPAQDFIARLRGLVDAAPPRQQLEGDGAALERATAREVSRDNREEILSHAFALDEASAAIEALEQLLAHASALHKNFGEDLDHACVHLKSSLAQMDEVEASLLRLLAANQPLPSALQSQADDLLTTLSRRRAEIEAAFDLAQKELARKDEWDREMRSVYGQQDSKASVLAAGIQLRNWQKIADESIRSEGSSQQEAEVAVPRQLASLSHFLSFEAEEIKNSPTLRILLTTAPPETRLSAAELLGWMGGFLAFLDNTAAPSPRVSVSLLEFLSKQAGARSGAEIKREVAMLAASFANAEGEYLQLVSRALGLSLTQPLSDFRSKALIRAELAIHKESARSERSKQSSPEELALHGGCLSLGSGIRAVYGLFESSPSLGQVALASLRPAEVSLVDYLIFMACVRLKRQNKDSLQLFKQIDQAGSGKLDSAEFAAGLRSHLGLWASEADLQALYSRLDSDGSGSISRIEFIREVNLKEYFQKEETYAVTKLQVLQATDCALQWWTDTVLQKVAANGSLEPQAPSDVGSTCRTEATVSYLLAHPPPDAAIVQEVAVHSDDLLSATTRELLQTLEDVQVD